MKRINLLILLLFFTSFSYGKSIDFDLLVERDDLYYEKFSDIPYTGEVTGRGKGKMVKGDPVGNFQIYYENGMLEWKQEIVTKDGETFYYSTSYFEDGKFKKNRSYIGDNWRTGIPFGTHEDYLDNGNLQYKSVFEDGKFQDVVYEYFDDDSIKMEHKVTGSIESWLELISKDILLDDMITVVRNFYENGNLKDRKEWKGETSNGTFIEWKENGDLIREDKYERGRMTQYTVYEEEGLVRKGDWKDGLWYETFTFKNLKGKLTRNEEGTLHGLRIDFKDNIEMGRRCYQNGEEVDLSVCTQKELPY